MIKRLSTDYEQKIYIASDADVLGKVTIGAGSSVWYHAVIRAEKDTITIGKETNIQDGCIIHTDPGYPVEVGDRVTVGHGAILHGCKVGSDCLIGMNAVILNGAQVGNGCIIGAGALITQNTVIPDGSMAFGSPAKVKRPLTREELEGVIASAKEYLDFAEDHFGA